MANYNVRDVPQVGGIKTMLSRISTRLTALESGGNSLKAAAVDGNTLKFYTTTDTTVAAAYTIDLPAEMFLDAASTTFVSRFAYAAATYPNTTNPNLDGKPVMVLGVKTKSADGKTTTVSYSFLNMSALVDTYTASDTTIAVSGYTLKVRVSEAANNALTVKNDGLHVDVSGKVDKVTTATSGDLVIFGSGGALSDSEHKIATDAEFTAMLDEVFPPVSGS